MFLFVLSNNPIESIVCPKKFTTSSSNPFISIMSPSFNGVISP